MAHSPAPPPRVTQRFTSVAKSIGDGEQLEDGVTVFPLAQSVTGPSLKPKKQSRFVCHRRLAFLKRGSEAPRLVRNNCAVFSPMLSGVCGPIDGDSYPCRFTVTCESLAVSPSAQDFLCGDPPLRSRLRSWRPQRELETATTDRSTAAATALAADVRLTHEGSRRRRHEPLPRRDQSTPHSLNKKGSVANDIVGSGAGLSPTDRIFSERARIAAVTHCSADRSTSNLEQRHAAVAERRRPTCGPPSHRRYEPQ